jgi:hypothetical protein
LCFLIKRHYENVWKKVKRLDHMLEELPAMPAPAALADFNESEPTAAILVSRYNGLGVHIFLNIFRLFPSAFKNVLFMSVATVDSDFFKEAEQVRSLTEKTRTMLEQYVEFSKKMGIPARYEMHVGTDVVESVSELCVEVSRKYSRVVFFAGELVFEKTQWYHRILHNETAYAVMRRIRFAGLPMVMVPARVSDV